MKASSACCIDLTTSLNTYWKKWRNCSAFYAVYHPENSYQRSHVPKISNKNLLWTVQTGNCTETVLNLPTIKSVNPILLWNYDSDICYGRLVVSYAAELEDLKKTTTWHCCSFVPEDVFHVFNGFPIFSSSKQPLKLEFKTSEGRQGRKKGKHNTVIIML